MFDVLEIYVYFLTSRSNKNYTFFNWHIKKELIKLVAQYRTVIMHVIIFGKIDDACDVCVNEVTPPLALKNFSKVLR